MRVWATHMSNSQLLPELDLMRINLKYDGRTWRIEQNNNSVNGMWQNGRRLEGGKMSDFVCFKLFSSDDLTPSRDARIVLQFFSD